METVLAIIHLIDKIDVFIFVLLLLLNIVFYKKVEQSCLLYLVLFLFIGIILPFWSMDRELERNIEKNGPAMDNFELLYTFLIFINYWVVLILQYIVLGLTKSLKSKD